MKLSDEKGCEPAKEADAPNSTDAMVRDIRRLSAAPNFKQFVEDYFTQERIGLLAEELEKGQHLENVVASLMIENDSLRGTLSANPQIDAQAKRIREALRKITDHTAAFWLETVLKEWYPALRASPIKAEVTTVEAELLGGLDNAINTGVASRGLLRDCRAMIESQAEDLAYALRRIDNCLDDAEAELKAEHAANASLRAKLDEPTALERILFLALRRLKAAINALALHFDQPITDENVLLWQELNDAGAAAATIINNEVLARGIANEPTPTDEDAKLAAGLAESIRTAQYGIKFSDGSIRVGRQFFDREKNIVIRALESLARQSA